MTIQELINELQEAIENGYKPDTRICVDTMPDVTEEETYWGISLDTDSSYGPKDQWKIAINVWPYTHESQVQLEDLIAEVLDTAEKIIAEEENDPTGELRKGEQQ
tara:strand:- start:442 stop:756 length:315 start_codon:yes stop_codon:yes gene_type:complete